MSPRALAASGTLLISMAAPAAAEAVPTIAPLKPCYVTANTPSGPQSEGYFVNASGFTPNSQVTLALDGQPVRGGESLQTDSAGALNVPDGFPAPFVPAGSQSFTITLTEDGNPANVATATAKSTALGVTVRPASARPTQKIRFKGLGFTLDRGVYAHYVRKGKVRKTVRMVRRTGECGKWKARKPQFPFAHPHTGRWIVRFDQTKRYVADPANLDGAFVALRIDVTLRRG
jgi:hypothetical protein